MNVKQAVPFFIVSSIETSIRFYTDGLGFQLTRQWIDAGQLRWCWLQHGGAALMLQEPRSSGNDSWVSTARAGAGVSIYFICEDALAIYRQLIARGVPASRPFVGNGMWVTGVQDPDRYRLFFESATDMPEDTQFAEGQTYAGTE